MKGKQWAGGGAKNQRKGGAGVSFWLQAARCVQGQMTHLVPHRKWVTLVKPVITVVVGHEQSTGSHVSTHSGRNAKQAACIPARSRQQALAR